MSYSFSVQADTKSEAVAKIAAELDKMVGQHPVHAHDQKQAQAVAETFLLLIGEPGEGQQVSVSVCGWLQWKDPALDAPREFTGANISVSASIIAAVKSYN